MNELIVDSFQALDTTAQVTTITHRESFVVRGTFEGAQTQVVVDTAVFGGATTDGAAHYILDTVAVGSVTAQTQYVASAITDSLSAVDAVYEGRYILHTEVDTASAVDTTSQTATQVERDAFTAQSAADQRVFATATITEVLRTASRATGAGVSSAADVFQALDFVSDAVVRYERIVDTLGVAGSAFEATTRTDVATDTFTARTGAAGVNTAIGSISDSFHIYSRASSPVVGRNTAGWMANTLGMAMTRMVGQFPACRAGGFAGGTNGLHTMGTSPATVDTGSVRLSKGADRVRISNVYCDGLMSNAALAVTSENDLRTPQTYTYDYRGRVGISNGRFDVGKGLTCQRMRMVLTADSIHLSRMQVVGGTSNRRL